MRQITNSSLLMVSSGSSWPIMFETMGRPTHIGTLLPGICQNRSNTKGHFVDVHRHWRH